jgi:hypothetical protein
MHDMPCGVLLLPGTGHQQQGCDWLAASQIFKGLEALSSSAWLLVSAGGAVCPICHLWFNLRVTT